MRISPSSFQVKKDRIWYEKLAKRYSSEDIVDFFVANILKGRIYAITMASHEAKEADDTYKDYLKRKQSLSYYFQQEMEKVLLTVVSPSDLFKSTNGAYPPIVNAYLDKSVSLDTLVILNDFVQFVPGLDQKYPDDIIWTPISLLITKYRPFVQYDKVKIRKLLNIILLNK